MKVKKTNGMTSHENGKRPAKNLEEFMESWSDDDEDSEDEVEENGVEEDSDDASDQVNGNQQFDDEETDDQESDDEESDDSGEDLNKEEKSQKKYIKNLSKSDPEFYNFLKEEGDEGILNQEEDSEEEEEPEEGQDEAEEESDSEDDSEEADINSKSIATWSAALTNKPNVQTVAQVVQAFRSAVNSMSGGDESEGGKSKFVVGDGSKFNAVLKLCIGQCQSAFDTLLKVSEKKLPNESKNWGKMNKFLKMYTMDLVKIVSATSSISVLSALLKHVHGLVPYFASIPKSAKAVFKALISVWSTHKDDKARVLAYMSILKLSRTKKEDYLEMVLKQMYMAYIRNVKFTSPNVWPNINFMRRSLSELYLLDQDLCYKYAFVYIRQLTIHLRNALMQGKNKQTTKTKKGPKDAIQSVYNWQFIHSINLWTQVLSDSIPSAALEPLIYPLIQLMTGAIKLVYSPAYFPLRFHLCRLLTRLSSATDKFVPVLPYYFDVLQTFDFGKKTNKVSMKPMNFSCILRLSKSQLSENGFKDAVIEQVYAGVLENLSCHSHKISFPEMVVPTSFQLREFVKKCPVNNYGKKMRQLLDKVNENSKIVLEKRRKINSFGVTDTDKILAWEAGVKGDKNLPLPKYYESWRAVNEKNIMKNMVKETPEFETNKLPSDDDESEDDESVVESEDEEEEESSKDRKRKAKESQNSPQPKKKLLQSKIEEDVDDEGDIVGDFDLDDFGADESSQEDKGSEEEKEDSSDEESD